MKSQEHNRPGSIDWTIVKEALRRAMQDAESPSPRPGMSATSHEVEISVLLNDVFGGEIVRTRNRKGFHFYNRINGERVDLAGHKKRGLSESLTSGNNSDATLETSAYFEQNDYTSFFLRFVTALEEAVGLGKYHPA